MRGFNADINTFATAGAVVPGVIPTAPGPKDVFKEGGDCKFTWTPDPSGQWKEMNVQLMSGDNWNMVPVTTIVKLDGTSTTTTSYTFSCPDVNPNSAIYFYQFSTPAAPKNLTWTTRFTIAAADGSVTAPANDTQPDGQKIPWGLGALVDQSKVVPPPSYLSGGSSPTSASSSSSSSTTASSSGSTSASASSSISSSTSSSASSSTSSSASSSASSSSSVATTPSSSSTTRSAVSTITVTSVAPTTSSSGSGNGALGAQVNVLFGTAALGLTAAVFALLS
ncbi:hypothetical protein LXA43DRAFT_973781 [Ganoderma leucocontextum]|nr:hypothetical protein LXA43DRAFT_973781 [Ganoderma leucocontextum]